MGFLIRGSLLHAFKCAVEDSLNASRLLGHGIALACIPFPRERDVPTRRMLFA